MQEILAEIWPPLLMVVFGGGSIVAAILGKAICSLDQNSSFRKSFNQCFNCLLRMYQFLSAKGIPIIGIISGIPEDFF